MDKELKKWCKTWSIKDIVENVFTAGMCFMGRKNATNKEAADYQKIIIKEIKSRINS